MPHRGPRRLDDGHGTLGGVQLVDPRRKGRAVPPGRQVDGKGLDMGQAALEWLESSQA